MILNSKNYFTEVYKVFNDIIQSAERSKYQAQNNFEPKKTAWLIINSSIGLCGAYNININKLVSKDIKEHDLVIPVGQKAVKKYKKFTHLTSLENVPHDFNYTMASSISLQLLEAYNDNKIDCIKVAYTKFINNATFEPTVLQLLPIVKLPKAKNQNPSSAVMEFEPSAEEVLTNTVPMYLNSLVLSTILESQVSEHASRRMAMDNATKNADDLTEKLSLEYNRKRQAAITQEISEIIAGSSGQDK